MGGHMPKIIENVKAMLLNETRRELAEYGYSAVTIRSVAHGVGIAAGTVYNYFGSKDELIALAVLEDWDEMLADLTHLVKTSDKGKVSIVTLSAIRDFVLSHKGVFDDEGAKKVYSVFFSDKHKLIVKGIAKAVRCAAVSDLGSEIFAEILLSRLRDADDGFIKYLDLALYN